MFPYFSLHNSTKANTLASLKPHLEKSIIEELYIFTKSQWLNSPKKILKEIKNKFEGSIVVRSSTRIEDSHNSTYAGFFHSELNVDSQNYKNIEKAVLNVIESYEKHKKSTSRIKYWYSPRRKMSLIVALCLRETFKVMDRII